MTLTNCSLVAFVATTHPERALAFYRDVLGLQLAEDTPFALVLRTPNATLRIQKVQEFSPLPFTALGWEVPDIRATAEQLKAHQVPLERFEGMGQDELGIWAAPGGALVAWFKDPDGNLLSLTQSP